MCPLHRILYIYIVGHVPPPTLMVTAQHFLDQGSCDPTIYSPVWICDSGSFGETKKKTEKRNGFLSYVQKHTRRQSRRTSQFDPLQIFVFHCLSPSAPSAQTRSKPFAEPQIHRWGKIIANTVGNCFDNVSTHHFYTKRIIDGIDRCVCGKKRQDAQLTQQHIHYMSPNDNSNT